MRIRRRPQPSPLQLAASDPTTSTAPQTPQQNAARGLGCWLEPGAGEDREATKLLHADADLGHKSGAARRLALPQDDDNVVVDCGRSMGAQHGGGADDGGHRRFTAVSNGHHSLDLKDSVACIGVVGGKSQPVPTKAEQLVTPSNVALQLAVVPAPAVAVKDEEKASVISNGSGGGAKKRRGPAVLLEGSRCSRVNGRGWRCSQPTLVGYSLCEHHLGKGRMRSAAAAAAARGRLGRTEHGATTRIPAAVGVPAPMAAVTAVAPHKAEAPSLPPC
ncbi:unnamed protein product [Urochloa decumbens]|uniref:WRC domain-containing protein n=1 Tax=Urochloa decumbens TaxID=240449 RepID=A0ABC9DDQ1_9POAL